MFSKKHKKNDEKFWRNWMHLWLISIRVTICSSSSYSGSASYSHCRSLSYCKKCCSKFRFIQNHNSQGSALCPASCFAIDFSAFRCCNLEMSNYVWTSQNVSLANMMKILDGRCGYYGLMRYTSLYLEMLIPRTAFTGQTKVLNIWYFTRIQSDCVVRHRQHICSWSVLFWRGNY